MFAITLMLAHSINARFDIPMSQSQVRAFRRKRDKEKNAEVRNRRVRMRPSAEFKGWKGGVYVVNIPERVYPSRPKTTVCNYLSVPFTARMTRWSAVQCHRSSVLCSTADPERFPILPPPLPKTFGPARDYRPCKTSSDPRRSCPSVHYLSPTLVGQLALVSAGSAGNWTRGNGEGLI